MLPTQLTPTEVLHVPNGNGVLALPLCRVTLQAAVTDANVHTFGNKPLVWVDGRAQFAEVAVLRLFEEEGWQGRWVETYSYRKHPRLWREWNAAGPSAQAHVPIEEGWVNERLHAIAAVNGNSFSGCWDVVAWRNERLVFAESKKSGKDKLRNTQLHWVESARRCGVGTEDLLVVEWELQ